MAKKLTREQLIGKIKRMETKLKNEKVLTNEMIKFQRQEVKNRDEQIAGKIKEADERRDKHLDTLNCWRKDEEALKIERLASQTFKDQRDRANAEKFITLSLALAQPHHYLIARQTFDKVHKGKGMDEVNILTTVSSMQTNYPFLFRIIGG